MTLTDVQSTDPNAQGYREFSLGAFHFRRDEYFAHITWPTGKHVISVDVFLRALQRDVAWDFFYGTVNFDSVFGTVNHYGTVDMFAGRFNDAYRKAELDHTENFETPLIRETFKAMLDDWTNAGVRPVRQPGRDRQAVRREGRLNTEAVTRRRVAANRMVGVPGDEQIRTDETHPDQPHVRRRAAGRARGARRAGLRGRGRRVQPVRLPQPQRRHVEPVSVVSVCKASLYCPTTEEYILPVIHGNDRVEWFVQLSDEIVWDVQDRDTGAPRAKVTMKAGDVAAMPGDIRHQGYSPKRSMLLVWENASPELPELIRTGKATRLPGRVLSRRHGRAPSAFATAVADACARRRHRRARGLHAPHPARRRPRDHPPGPPRPAPRADDARHRLRPADRRRLRHAS